MQRKNLLASGLSSLEAQNIAGVAFTGLTATGSTQADALLSNGDFIAFTTVASGTGYRLPLDTEPGDWVAVYNGGANALSVYPPVGGSINALSTDAAFSMAANKFALFFRATATLWVSNLTA